MVLPATLQLVPASLLVFILTAPAPIEAWEIPWPFGSRILRSLPQDGGQLDRDGPSISSHPAPMLVSVRKMGSNGSEMFFPEYWRFDAVEDQVTLLSFDKREPAPESITDLEERENTADWTENCSSRPLQAAFALHSEQHYGHQPLLGRFINSPRAIFGLDKRAYQCPGGTTVCTNINQSNSCCPTGTVCQSITDTGSGAVGCCPEGSTCSQQVGGCGAADTSCPGTSGGGCCIQGYSCNGVGCKSLFIPFLDDVAIANPRNTQASPTQR